jgi:hypothetical protein
MVGAASAQVPQPAVTVAGITQAAATHVLQTSVVDTTAAQPETETIEADSMNWARAGAALGGCVSLRYCAGGRDAYMAKQVTRVLKR